MSRERYTLLIILGIYKIALCCVDADENKSNLLIFFYRDFAYVARDNLTQVLKCHVFRCDSPAKNIATSLHEMCSKVCCCYLKTGSNRVFA